MVHPKLLKWKNVDLTKIQNLAAVDQDIADAERDLEILKQRLPQATPTIRQHIRGQKKSWTASNRGFKQRSRDAHSLNNLSLSKGKPAH